MADVIYYICIVVAYEIAYPVLPTHKHRHTHKLSAIHVPWFVSGSSQCYAHTIQIELNDVVPTLYPVHVNMYTACILFSIHMVFRHEHKVERRVSRRCRRRRRHVWVPRFVCTNSFVRCVWARSYTTFNLPQRRSLHFGALYNQQQQQ